MEEFDHVCSAGDLNITRGEEREIQLAMLRTALIEAEQSGPSEPFDFEAFIADKRPSAPATPGP